MDYRDLNGTTKRNSSPLLMLDEIFDRLGGAREISKMDLKINFHQSRLNKKKHRKPAFNKKCEQFEYWVMPMGICHALSTFQSLMNNIFHGCID